MKWMLRKIHWYSRGRCWSWWKIQKSVFYAGNQVEWTWGRLSLIFERRKWIHPKEK